MRVGLLLAVGLLAGCTAQPLAPPPAPVVAAPPPDGFAGLAEAPEVAASHLTEADVGRLPRLGSEHAGTLPLLGSFFALPSGRWTVVFLRKSTFDHYPPGADIGLVRREGTAITAALEIAGNARARPAQSGFPLNPVCAAVASHGSELPYANANAQMDQPSMDQDCVLLARQQTGGWEALGEMSVPRAIFAAARTMHASLPPVVSLIAIGQTSRQYRLTEQLWLPGPPEDTDLEARIAWSQSWRQEMRRQLGHGGRAAAASVAEIR